MKKNYTFQAINIKYTLTHTPRSFNTSKYFSHEKLLPVDMSSTETMSIKLLGILGMITNTINNTIIELFPLNHYRIKFPDEEEYSPKYPHFLLTEKISLSRKKKTKTFDQMFSILFIYFIPRWCLLLRGHDASTTESSVDQRCYVAVSILDES